MKPSIGHPVEFHGQLRTRTSFSATTWLLVVCASALGSLFSILVVPQDVVGTAAALTWLCLPVMALPFSMQRGVGVAVHPWSIIFGLFVYSWVLRLTITGLDRGGFDAMLAMFQGRSPEIIYRGLFLGGLGLASLTLGYLLTMALPLRPGTDRLTRWHRLDDQSAWNARRMEFAALAVLAIAVVGLILLQTSISADLVTKRFNEIEGGGMNRATSVEYGYLRLSYLSHAVFIMLLIYRYKFRRLPSPLLRLLLPVSGVVALFVPLSGSSRAGVALVLIDILLLQMVLGRRIRPVRIVAVSTVMVLVVAWMLSVRVGTERTLGESFIRTFAGRDLFDVGKLSHISLLEPGILNGQTLWGWLLFPVSEGALPFDKPMWTGLGPFVSLNSYGRGGITGVPAGLMGELYLNVGYVGVVVGSALFGVLVAKIYRTILPSLSEGRVIGSVMFAILLVRFIIFGLSNDFGTGVLSSLSDLLPILAILAFVAPRKGAAP